MKRYYSEKEMIRKQPADGADGRIVHGDALTVASWVFEAGTLLPTHDHHHEQIALVVEGELQLTVGEETRTLHAGDAAVIPGNVPHEARAITRCRLVDAFSPKRDDLV